MQEWEDNVLIYLVTYGINILMAIVIFSLQEAGIKIPFPQRDIHLFKENV